MFRYCFLSFGSLQRSLFVFEFRIFISFFTTSTPKSPVETILFCYPFLFSLIIFLVLFFFSESASPSRDRKVFSTSSTPKSPVLASETVFFCYPVLFSLIIFLVLFFFSESEKIFFIHRRYYSASHFFPKT